MSTLVRLPDWDLRLCRTLEKSVTRKFDPGHFDCGLFVCLCIRAMTGKDVGRPFRGRYSTMEEAKKVLGRGGIVGAIGRMAQRYNVLEVSPKLAHRGDVVLFKENKNWAVGIIVERWVALVDHEGYQLINVDDRGIKKAWHIG